jgi:hypothetical protein
MGQLLVARGRAADASRYFQTALAEDPQMEAAASALSQLTASQAPALQLPEQSANRPPIAVEQPLPMNMPAAGPQYTPQYGPQISYPSEARTPDQGRSTYVPPAYQVPSGPVQTPAVPAGQSPSAPWVSQATPRYLPPVNAAPAAMRR